MANIEVPDDDALVVFEFLARHDDLDNVSAIEELREPFRAVRELAEMEARARDDLVLVTTNKPLPGAPIGWDYH